MAITRRIARILTMRCLVLRLIFTPPNRTKGLLMKIPYFLTLFLIFLGWAAIKRRQASAQEKEIREAFWKKEEDANTTRRMDISQLPYIAIPYDRLPFQLIDSPEIQEQELILKQLSEKNILNLSGTSNTDIKLMYGAANLAALTEYDENFTTMCIALNQWGNLLYSMDKPEDARKVLEFAIASGSDISASYLTLATIYQSSHLTHLIPELIRQAEGLNTLSKKTIILKLSEFVHN